MIVANGEIFTHQGPMKLKMSCREMMRTPSQNKRMVEAIKAELMHKLELSEEEFCTARTRRAMTARQRVAGIAHEVLIDNMSAVDIARMLGIRRTTYVALRQAYKEGTIYSP